MGKVLLQSGEATKGVDAKTPRCIDAKSVSEEDTKLLRHYGTKVVSGIKDDRTLRRKDDKFKTEIAAICRHSERLAKESSNTNLIQLQGMKINLNEIDYASMPLGIFASKLVSLLGWKAQPTSNVGGVGTPPYVAIRFWGQTDWWGRGELTGNNITEDTINFTGYGCSKDNKFGLYSGYYCGALILFDGWKISDDYPWK